jgi:hypothetical protein
MEVQALHVIATLDAAIDEKVRLDVIGDGAGWIGKWGQELVPSAAEILDYDRGREHLHKVAALQ